MRLISAELTNICQFCYKQVQFAPGLTAILGRNGSGKSNLIKNVYAAVTGDFGRNDGVKTDNICQFAGAGAPAKIHTTLEHSGTILEVTRSLRPIGTRLEIIPADGTKRTVITKTSEANEAIINILGVSGRMLADYVFVDQWSIFDFLSMMPAERAKAFQRLFRTERAEALWKFIGEHHDKLVVPTPGISKDVVIRRLEKDKQREIQLTEQYRVLQQAVVAHSAQADRRLVVAWDRKKLLLTEVATLQARCGELQKELQDLAAKAEEIAGQAVVLEKYVNSFEPKIATARESLALWRTYTAVEKARTTVRAQLSLLEAEEHTRVEPKKPNDFVGSERDPLYEHWWIDHHARVRRYNAAQHFMQLLNADDPYCPTCGTPRHALEVHRTNYERSVAELAQEVANDARRIAASDEYRTLKRGLEASRAEISRRREALTRQLDDVAEVTKPEQSPEALQTLIKKFDEFVEARDNTKQALDKVVSAQANKKAALDAIGGASLQPKLAELKLLNITEEEAREAQVRLDHLEEFIQKKAALEAELNILKRNIRDDEVALRQLETIEREAGVIRSWSEYCLDMRHIMHRDSLPKLVAQNYLELMQDEINNLLTRFDSPFHVETDDSLSFLATFKDGRKVPAARLSGGEKVLLAIAFRVAVNDVFARDLGMLVLDEPTAGLDDGNLSCLKIALERLKELSSSRGLQLIMITHEKELSYLFDHKIEL